MKTLAMLLVMLCSIAELRAEEWQRAELYFVDWDVVTRAALTSELVRELADYRRSFSRDLSPIIGALAINKLRPTKTHASLVVDLFTDTGARVTYYTSFFDFCTADSKWKHLIDAQFRQYFSRLMKSRQRPNEAMRPSDAVVRAVES